MISKALIAFYCFIHGRLGLPGGGWLLRRLRPLVPGLRAYPLPVPGIGTAIVDFQDDSAYGLVNFCLGEMGQNSALFYYLEKVLKPGDVLWDIGSNIGFIPIHFANSRFGLSAIHAFEPNPQALRPLTSLFAGHNRVRVHPVGLGDRDGQLTMHVLRSGSMISSFVRPMRGSQQIIVPIRRADSYQQERTLELPDVIKIDVEGFEPQVFAGLEAVIRAKRPIIFFEHTFLATDQVSALQPINYGTHYILDGGGLARHPSSMGPSHDAIFVPDEKEKLIR